MATRGRPSTVCLAEVLTFEREIIIEWDRPQPWFTQDYCLVYTR